MTRVTFGLFRKGVREPGLNLTAAGATFIPPTPMPTATAAVARYHREGPDRAMAAMDRSYRSSSYWGQRGTSQAGWAEAMRSCFQTYVDLAQLDPRPAFAIGLNRDVAFPPDEIGVHVDVVLLDPSGYVGRLALWDKTPLTSLVAARYAAPAWQALEEELGEGRIAGVEVWHLRSATQMFVSPEQAAFALPEVERILHRLVL